MKKIKIEESSSMSRDELASTLECPICLNVPRELPIPQCSAGHIICRKCRRLVTSCPTCRRKFGRQDLTSTLAAALIDKVPHKCKYSEYGCEVKGLLAILVKHEEKCPERIVKCPKCGEMPQLKKYHEHVKSSSCYCVAFSKGGGQNMNTYLSFGFMKWNGKIRGTEEEFDLKKELMELCCLIRFEKRFYLMEMFDPKSKFFIFNVFMAENTQDDEDAKDYTAKLTIHGGNLHMTYETTVMFPVCSIEQLPKSLDEFLTNNKNCYLVPYTMMRNYFQFEDVGENNHHCWHVKYEISFEVTQDEK